MFGGIFLYYYHKFYPDSDSEKKTFYNWSIYDEVIRPIQRKSCILHRQPDPDPRGSRTGNRLSIISYHLSLPLNLPLTLL